MGNDSTKSKSTKRERPAAAVIGSKKAEITKNALILFKPWSERTTEIMEYFYDALNHVKPVGFLEILRENVVDLSKHDDEYVRNRTSQWLKSADNVVLLCIAADQAEHFPRQAFIDGSGQLPSKFFPLVFGTEIPSLWPECYSLGIADLDKIERPNDFESDGLQLLGVAIRAIVEERKQGLLLPRWP